MLPTQKSPQWPYAESANDVGGVLTNPSIADEHRMTGPPAESAMPAFTVGHADDTAEDDLPQVVADTITDLLHTPRARGWIHFYSAATAIVAGAALVPVAWITVSSKAGLATLIYAVGIVAMFGISAAYHRVHWRSPAAEKWMMRVDHSVIFVFIAASYTPFALLAMPERTGAEALTLVWAGAGAGVVLKMCWPSAPRWLGLPLYLLLGYSAIWFAGTLVDGAGSRWSRSWSSAVCCTTSAPFSTAYAGRIRGQQRSATTSFFTPSPQRRRCATTSRPGASSSRSAMRVSPWPPWSGH